MPKKLFHICLLALTISGRVHAEDRVAVLPVEMPTASSMSFPKGYQQYQELWEKVVKEGFGPLIQLQWAKQLQAKGIAAEVVTRVPSTTRAGDRYFVLKSAMVFAEAGAAETARTSEAVGLVGKLFGRMVPGAAIGKARVHGVERNLSAAKEFRMTFRLEDLSGTVVVETTTLTGRSSSATQSALWPILVQGSELIVTQIRPTSPPAC
jgi:hypothetical protein